MSTPTLAMRPADRVLDPADLGGARCTRHSFARTLLRRAAERGWRVGTERFDVDDHGRGTVVYRVEAEGHVWRFVAFSNEIPEAARTDRVVAEAWDITGALVEGGLDEARIERLRAEVPRQEAGRADAGTIIWTRANRSARFFDYVVDRLAAGRQPDAGVLGSAPYVLRSTAFYSNGKFGLADFERFDAEHPLGVPYRAHMLTAWLLRELAYDLVEHCARRRDPDAARLTGAWRRHLGLGNATGLGMVPYVVNHPAVLDAWVQLRERALASVLAREVPAGHPDVARVVALLGRARDHLAAQVDLATAPYPTGPEVAATISEVLALAEELAACGTVAGISATQPWRALHEAAERRGPECRGIVASVLSELCDPAVDSAIEAALRVDETSRVRPSMSCGEVARLLDEHYAWCDDLGADAPDAEHHFWFSSANNEEPRRAVSTVDPGEPVQHRVDVVRQVRALRRALAAPDADAEQPVAVLLARAPSLRQVVARVQRAASLTYPEVHDNLLARDFLPLNVQRFQLAVYGMENFSPQSTDWLRVTLFSGAPRVGELADGTVDDDWIFVPRPTERSDDVAPA
ncbi:hypothetical protein ACFFOS_26500 [Nocardioides kongjuensis]|uniref:Uncharacterized protein n=1 Tax=Nocardioides kongjuensis TaxID=349522 RepID=A0A852RPG0_9ACTN|nr:hypothetical protein [Nocardioides kongjuensis]NYD32458.1 hypothetical protein [Nocardioides kongjuensis]